MSSGTSKVAAVRLRNETYEFFSDKPLRQVIESVHELAVKKEIEIEKEGKVVIPGHTD